MSDKELKSTIAVSVDGKGVEVGVAAVKKSLESMGAAAASAGVGFNGVATQADEALKKADRSTKAFVAQVKNAATDVKAELDKLNIADKFELKAVSKGLDPALYKPYVDYLRTVVTEQDRLALSAAATGNSVAMSARAMSNAMRGVPAQFTDIVTSLASGQAPLTVLMQQGGQLKDMFGGVGNAFKALGSYVVGLINPISLTVAAVGVLAVAHNQGAKEAEAYAKALILTGNAAGATVGQLQGMAARVAESTGATQGAAAEALTAFANVSGVAVGSYERFAGVAIKIQKELGVSVADTAAKFADLGKAPLEASIKLNDSMHYLTAEVYRQIKALEEHGDKAGAAAIAQKAYADASERAMDGLKANLGTAEKAWRSIAETAKGAWDAMLGVGRATSINDQISSVTKQIAEIQSKAGADGKVSLWEGGGKLSALQEQLRYLTLIKNSQEANAAGDAKRAALQITLQNFDARSIDMLDKKGKMQRELTLAQADGDKLVTAGLITQVDLNKQLAAIREKYKESSKGKTGDDFASQRSAAKEWAEFYEKFTNLADKAAGKVGELTSAQVELEKYLKSPAYANMAEPARQLALESAYAAIAQQQLAKEIAAISKENEAAATAYDQLLKSQGKHNQSLDDAIQKQREHNATIGVSVEAGAALELANMRAHADALERKADLADLIYLDGQYADSLRKEAEKLREFANAKQVGAAKKAADEAQKEWRKAAEKIGDTITDALMRGFESGKGFAENLRDTVVNMFKTLVLRPVISAIVNPVAQGLAGAMGLSGAANAAGAANTLTSAGSLAGGITAFGGTLATGFMNTLLGSGLSGGLTAAGAMIANGAWASGLGMAAGALGPLALGIAALSMIGNKDKSSANTGDSSATYGANGALLALQTTNGLSKTTTDMAQALQTSYMTAAKSLGIALAQTNYNVNTNSGREGQNPNTIIDSTVNGRRYTSGEVSNSDTAAMQLAASRAVFSALQGSELPAYLSKMFDGLNAASMTQEQISNTLAYAQSIKQVRDALLETREPLQILKDNVAQGFAALGTSAESFKTDFVAALDAGVSPENLAKWQALQATMTSLADMADKEAKKRDAAAKAIQDSLDKELATATKWADKMGVLQGTTTERQLELNADLATTANAGTQALIRQVYAQEALQAATTSAKDSLKTFADSLKSLASGVAGAQSRVDDLALQAQIDAANKANAVAEKFRSLGKSLRDFLDGETLAPSAAFGKLLAKAMSGDGEAMQALPGAATAAINLAKESAATATDFALQKASILSQLSQAVDVANTLAAQTVPVPQAQDPMVAAVQNLQDAINDLRDGITQSISVDLAARLGAIDTNLSGAIDLTEFRTYFSGLASDDTLQKIFTALDSDSSGVISKLEAIKSNTSNYASVIASDSLLLSRMQSDFNAWFANSRTGDSATLGAGGPVVTNTGGGTATVSGASGTTQINAGMSVVDAAASNQSLADAWKTQYSSSQTLADNELARAAIDARNWITNFPVGTPLAWAGGSISTNGQFAMWERSPGQFVQINPATGDDIRALAQAYPELLTEWRSEGYRFASGGAFTNSIVRRPTSFDIGQMGEAGPEAIMPLTNIGGKLGVLGIGTNNAALLDELRALRAEVEGLRIEARATATNTNKTAKMLDRAMPDGDAIATRVAA